MVKLNQECISGKSGDSNKSEKEKDSKFIGFFLVWGEENEGWTLEGENEFFCTTLVVEEGLYYYYD